MNHIKKIGFLLLILILLLMACSNDSNNNANGGNSDLDYPTKPIQFIIPFAAGGSTDVIARAIAEYAPEYIGESLAVENVTGAGGTVGITDGINAKNDGYTVTMGTAAGFTALPHTRELTYDIEDMEPLISFHNSANVLIVNGDSPYDSVQDIIDAANNGEEFNYGNSGAGNFGHLAIETFFAELDGEHSYIPYEGSAPAIAALLGGHIEAATVHPPEVKSYVQAGDIKILGVFGPERLEGYEDVPTIGEAFAEAGVDYPYGEHDFAVWMFAMVPAGTPSEINNYLTEQFENTLNDEEFVDFAEEADFTIDILKGEEIIERLEAEREVYEEIISNVDI